MCIQSTTYHIVISSLPHSNSDRGKLLFAQFSGGSIKMTHIQMSNEIVQFKSLSINVLLSHDCHMFNI